MVQAVLQALSCGPRLPDRIGREFFEFLEVVAKHAGELLGLRSFSDRGRADEQESHQVLVIT